MDTHIEEKYFKSVTEIFSKLGEQEFRKLEKDCLHEVAEFENIVISTGGGAPCFFNNIEFMNEHGITVYLKLTPEQLSKRLEHSYENKRPLLSNRKGEELTQFISEGLAKRETFYAKATISVYSENEDVVTQILNFIKHV